MFNLFNNGSEVISRLNESIDECKKSIALFHEKNLFDDELQEKIILNVLKYIKEGDFSKYMNEKSNLNHEQMMTKYSKKKVEEKNE